jgi:hypothetical protein
MTFPKSIRIGYRDFAVEDWDTKHASSAGRYGECDKANAVIRIDTSYGPVKAVSTLLHEVMHGCYDIAGITDEDNEERTVTQLSNQMTQVFRDNPELLAYLKTALRP